MGITERKVKGRAYYYLEKTIRLADKKWKKIYLYLGSVKPVETELKELEKRLDRKVSEYIENEFIGPKTEFIDRKMALKLERIKNEHKKLLEEMDKKSRKAWLGLQREVFITNTNAIEGSRITLDQTRKILELKKNYEADEEELEVINMEKCLELYDKYLGVRAEITESGILKLHFLLLKAIPGYEAHSGVWRTVNVFIRASKYEFPNWKEVPGLMAGLLAWYKENRDKIHPVELAAKFHARLVTIHPFADGNGRIARLLMNYILQINGFPFLDIPYEKRVEYFETQEKAHFGGFKEFTYFLINQIIKDHKKMKGKWRLHGK